jgi:dTDP-4-dehydrorhamnose 3,5-epimerase
MRYRKLAVDGAVQFTPTAFPDQRGLFVSPFQEQAFIEAVGRPFTVAQTNHSRSAAGVLRGIHFTRYPPGQEKYVYCPRGRALDVVVDIRVGSPTFGRSEATELDPSSFRAVFVPDGVGHAFLALEPDTVVSYLVSTGYAPQAERAIHPLDPELALPWPAGLKPILSGKDARALTLAEARRRGMLPRYGGNGRGSAPRD